MGKWQGEWWQNPKFHSCSEHIVELYLSKNLAGSPRKISDEEFIEWAEAGHAPDEEAKHHLREALCGLKAWDILLILRDGRTHPENTMKLIVDCAVDRDSKCRNNFLRTFYPHLPARPRKKQWDEWD